MTNEYNKKITYFLLSCLLFGSMFISITKVAADIDRKEELQPGEYHIEKLQYNNQTASERRSTNRLRLINFAQEQEYLKFASESPMNVFLVNESETASWIANETINAKKSWENKTRINQDITYENLLNWGFEEKIFQKDSGENFKEISFYVVVVNQNTGVNSYTLRYDYENEFGSFVD